MPEENDIEIADMENYVSSKSEEFSFTTLLMIAMKKCIENGAKEMREGYWNIKSDKFGNLNKVWIPDSRKQFIESVKTFRMLLERDFDKDIDLGKIEKKIGEKHKELCKIEDEDWKTASSVTRKVRYDNQIYPRPNSLHKDLPYYQEFIEYKIDQYRIIFKELCMLIKRLDDYSAIMWTA